MTAVAKVYIDEFLRRPLRDFRWMKDLSDKDIDEACNEMDFPFTVPLRRHQKIGFLLALAEHQMYFQYEMGLGKTGMSLEIISFLIKNNIINKALVLVPTNEVADGWEEEIKRWGIDIPYVILDGPSHVKWKAHIELERGVVIATYPGVVHMTCTKQSVPGKKNMKMKPDKVMVRQFVKGIDGVWYDEVTKCKNHDTLTFRISNAIAHRAGYRFGLAGRVFGRDPQDVWGQFFLIDRGATFGESLGFFRDAFFIKKQNWFGGPYSFDYKFDKTKEEAYNRIMANSSIRFGADECLDMPQITYIKRKFNLPESTAVYYQKALEEIRQARGRRREVEHAFIRMRQISSGFLGFKDDDTGERSQLEFPENRKLDLLLDLIDEMPEGSKFIVGVDFTWSGAAISKVLHKAKIKHGWLYGGTKDWPTMKAKFDGDDDFKGLIVQSKKGAYGLNLQRANYLFYYESPVPVLDRDQFTARINRQGQEKHVFIYDLVCRGTADETILAYHREGKNLYEALVKNPDEALANA